MASFTVGTLWTGGCAYTCTISYDTPTRSGDKVKIKNVKATITSASDYQTLNRIAVSVNINGVSKAYNKTVLPANDTGYPSSKEVTIIDSDGYEFTRLEDWFYIDVTFKSTGYGDNWDSDFGHASTDDWDNRAWIGCPSRTYSVTFNANGGSGAPSAQSKTYGSALTLSSTVPTYSGYDFKGWSGSNGTTYQPGSSYTSNADLTLTAIWQAQTTDLEDIDDIELGEAPEISWTPPSSSLTYKIKLSLGEWSWESDTISPGIQEELYTYDDYTVPLTVAEQLPNQTEGLMKCVLTTYNAGDPTGTSEKYFTVTVPDTVTPTISNLSITDGSANALNVFLQAFSFVEAVMNVAGAYGSTVETVKLTVGDEVISVTPESSSVTLRSDFLHENGTVSVSVEVEDSRGRTAISTSTITVHEYERPYALIEMTPGDGVVEIDITPIFSGITGNAATYKLNSGSPVAAVSGQTYHHQVEWPDVDKQNYEAIVTVTDAVTFSVTFLNLYPGKGDRFDTLSGDDFYVGMDERGWKTDVPFFSYDGGIEDGKVWFTRLSGSEEPPVGFDFVAGVGIPVKLESDADYELVYSANRSDDDMIVFVSFFKEENEKYSYISSTYSAYSYIKPGEEFHTPGLETGTLWGIVVLGEKAANSTREYYDIVLRKIERDEESLAWEMETGVLGLDTPNQKYISRIQLRIDYEGSLKIEIAYDNDYYSVVHESECDHMRSITVPIKVKRNDHFKIRLSGVGQTRLYSFGYETEEGSGRCLI